MYCNHSGGMSIGSLSADGMNSIPQLWFLLSIFRSGPAISNITMRNIQVYKNTNALMIKTFPGGTGAVGYVKDSLFENFWSYDTTYALDIDQYWQGHTTPDTGAVQISSLTFINWTGTVDDGIRRAPIVIRGSDIVPLTDITLSNINMWTVNSGKLLQQCKNVYGAGYCADKSTSGPLTTFTSTMTVTTPPPGYTPPVKLDWAVEGYGTTDPIPIYTPPPLWPPASTSSVLPPAQH
jgi:rhamnogalacturonan hydrolase